MYLRAIKYKGEYIAPGSTAYELYHDKTDKNRKKLDKHLDQLDKAKRKLEGLE